MKRVEFTDAEVEDRAAPPPNARPVDQMWQNFGFVLLLRDRGIDPNDVVAKTYDPVRNVTIFDVKETP